MMLYNVGNSGSCKSQEFARVIACDTAIRSQLRNESAKEILLELKSLHRKSDKTFLQAPHSKVKLLEFSVLSLHGHALLCKQHDGRVLLMICLNDVVISKHEKQAFQIIKDGQRIVLKVASEESRNTWVNRLSNLNSASQIYSQSAHSLRMIPSDKLAKRCQFSSSVIISGTFLGGILSDIIQFGAIHCNQPDCDNGVVQGLLVMVKENDIFEEFTKESKSIFTQLLRGTQRKSKHWRKRITNFVMQVSRAYHLFSAKQRLSFIDACDFNGQNEEILVTATISEPEREMIEIRPNYVLPRWGEQTIDLREISTQFIAEQLTCFEAKLHKQMDIVGLISNSGVAVNSIVSWWNHIASWTSSCILCEPNKKAQCSMYKIFVNIAEKLLKLRNYSSLAQIITGLRHHSVSRLRGLNTALNPKVVHRVEKLEEFVSPMNNYSLYRSLSKEAPCLRFLAVHQRDIRFICDSNPKFIDKKVVINAERLWMIGDCLHTLGLDYPEHSYTYSIERDDEFQRFLSQLKSVSDDDLFTLSFVSESSRGEENRASQLEVRRSSTYCNPLHNSTELRKLYHSDRTVSVDRGLLQIPSFSRSME